MIVDSDVVFSFLILLVLVCIFFVYRLMSKKFDRGVFCKSRVFFYVLMFLTSIYCLFCFYRLYKRRVDSLFFGSILSVNRNNIEKYGTILSLKNKVIRNIKEIEGKIEYNKKLIDDINKKKIDNDKKYTNEPGKNNLSPAPTIDTKVVSGDDVKKIKDLEDKNASLEKEKSEYNDLLKDIDDNEKIFKSKNEEINEKLSKCSVGFISGKNKKDAEDFLRKYEEEEHVYDSYVSDIESKYESLCNKYKNKSDGKKENDECKDCCKHGS